MKTLRVVSNKIASPAIDMLGLPKVQILICHPCTFPVEVLGRICLRTCLHRGGGPPVCEVTCGGSPHLSCKRDHIKMRDYVTGGLRHLPGVSHLHVNRP